MLSPIASQSSAIDGLADSWFTYTGIFQHDYCGKDRQRWGIFFSSGSLSVIGGAGPGGTWANNQWGGLENILGKF